MTLPTETFASIMRVIDLLGQGQTLTAACDVAGLSYTSFRKYVADTVELQKVYQDAEQRGYDVMADRLVTIDQFGGINGISDPKMLAVLSKNIQWFLARKRPQQYGDRMLVEHNITADQAIIQALSRGKERATQALLEGVAYAVIDETLRIATPTGDVLIDPELAELI